MLQSRPTMFGNRTWDTSSYVFLKVRVKPSQDQGMRFFVNIQTDGPGRQAICTKSLERPKLTCYCAFAVRSDLFQHRLWLGDPGEWQDVLVPFQDFTLTNAGTLSETQIEMFREKVCGKDFS